MSAVFKTNVFKRLTVATHQDVDAATTADIGKGALRSSFLKGPVRDHSQPGTQPPLRTFQFNLASGLLPQLPDDILHMIVEDLEPIWLFQLEQTCTRMARFLRSKGGNHIWYKSLPGPMLAMPEFFQNEAVISQRSPNSPVEFDRVPFLPNTILNTFSATTALLASPGFVNADDNPYSLPSLDSITTNTLPLNLIDTMTGYEDVVSYVNIVNPILHSAVIRYNNNQPRIRTLALGGPYQKHFDYRRELLGHLAYTSRCRLCLEACPPQGLVLAVHQQWETVGGFRMCSFCVEKMTVPDDELDKVNGLREAIVRVHAGQQLQHWSATRQQPQQMAMLHWRPLIDDITRQLSGMGFETLVAKERYLEHINEVKKASTHLRNDVFQGRRTLRNRMITVAQNAWRDGVVPGVDPARVAEFRRAAVSVSQLGNFLFAPCDISHFTMYRPETVGLFWPDDPVMTQRYTRDCHNRSDNWKRTKVMDMLVALVNDPNTKGDLLALELERFHVRRLESSLTMDSIAARVWAPGAVPAFIRLVLSKVFVGVPPNVTGGPRMRTAGLRAALRSTGRLAQGMVKCPMCLASPRGVENVVRHYREEHPQIFYGSLTWDIIL